MANSSRPTGEQWRIIYSDFSVRSSEDGPWTDVPSRDVQVVLFRDMQGRWQMRHGANTKHCDFFRLDDNGEVVGTDLTGMIDHVVHELGIVKEGRMLSKQHWDRVYQFAKMMCVELNEAS